MGNTLKFLKSKNNIEKLEVKESNFSITNSAKFKEEINELFESKSTQPKPEFLVEFATHLQDQINERNSYAQKYFGGYFKKFFDNMKKMNINNVASCMLFGAITHGGAMGVGYFNGVTDLNNKMTILVRNNVTGSEYTHKYRIESAPECLKNPSKDSLISLFKNSLIGTVSSFIVYNVFTTEASFEYNTLQMQQCLGILNSIIQEKYPPCTTQYQNMNVD